MLFLSYMMITALLWMLCSLLWGFASGIRTGVGFVEKWSHIEEAARAHPHLGRTGAARERAAGNKHSLKVLGCSGTHGWSSP